MKYYSEITKKNYDTVEALEEAEAKIKTQADKKLAAEKDDKNVVNTERKEAAQVVEKAFALASQVKKDNSAKRDELDKQNREIDKKYRAKNIELQKEYDAKIEALTQEQEAEEEKLGEAYDALDKADEEALEKAYAELSAFCKKYGAYHYSVDTAGAELFPMLMGFGRIEKAQNLFQSMFDSMFNLW